MKPCESEHEFTSSGIAPPQAAMQIYVPLFPNSRSMFNISVICQTNFSCAARFDVEVNFGSA